MEGIYNRTVSWLAKRQNSNEHRHLQTDERSVAAAPSWMAACPHFSLKARMLGGQAKTIMRQGGTLR
jgi:hypothetical protein